MIAGNEIADWLAERGADGRRECGRSAAAWATAWKNDMYEALRRRPPPPTPHPPAARARGGGPPAPPNTLGDPRGVG